MVPIPQLSSDPPCQTSWEGEFPFVPTTDPSEPMNGLYCCCDPATYSSIASIGSRRAHVNLWRLSGLMQSGLNNLLRRLTSPAAGRTWAERISEDAGVTPCPCSLCFTNHTSRRTFSTDGRPAPVFHSSALSRPFSASVHVLLLARFR